MVGPGKECRLHDDEKISAVIKKQELETRLDDLTSQKKSALQNLSEIEAVINKEKNITDISSELVSRYELNGLERFDLKIALRTTLSNIRDMLTNIDTKTAQAKELLESIHMCSNCSGSGFQTKLYVERSLGNPTPIEDFTSCKKCNGTGELN